MKKTCLNQVTGAAGEDLAARYLVANGFRLVQRNFRCRYGEVDIIATKQNVLHFIEVKTRTSDLIPGRLAVNQAKQRHIRLVANHYRQTNPRAADVLISFDVIEITKDEVVFLENCFY